MDIIIESLSTGEVMRTIEKIDDFTGRELPITNVPRAGDLVKLREQQIRAKARQAQRSAQAMHTALTTMLTGEPATISHKPFKRRF